MCNAIYMMKDEKREFALFKIGFAKELENRVKCYATHNPMIECVSHMATYTKSKHQVEIAFQTEFELMGYERVSSFINGQHTEWFKVEYNDPFYSELCEKGLSAFKCGKNRKNLGCYVLVK